METIDAFFDEFWAPLIGALLGGLLVWFWKQGRSDPRVPLLNEKSFPELAARSKCARDQLLREASTLAFQRWRNLLPVLVLAVSLAAGTAMALALSNSAVIPKSIWIQAAVGGVIGAIGGVLAIRLTTRLFRPLLHECLRRSEPA